MPGIKEIMELLIVLQDKDIILDKFKKQLADNPGIIGNFREEQAKLRSDAENEKKILLDMQKKKKEKEMDLQSKEESVKKHNMELNSVKTNDAYKALLSEINQDKKDQSVLEDEILELMEKIEKETANLKSAENELKKKENEINSKISKVEDDSSKIKAEIEKLQADRDEFAKKIPQDILSRYDHIKESRDGIAVVGLDGNNCGGCSTVLRPQTINDIIKGKDFVICDNCSRIIYKKNGT